MPQRSPIIFWLLLAATISVDAVVVTQVAGDRYSSTGYLTALLHALIISQLSVVCIWSALRVAPTVWTRTAPICAVAISSLAAGLFAAMPINFRGWTAYWNYLGYFGLHAAALLASLWFLQRTNYWRRRTGVTRTWQFSLAHALIVTTLIGVLSMFIRNNVFLANGGAINVAVGIKCVALAVASAAIWSLSWNWFFRLASVIAIATLLGVAIVRIFFGSTFGFDTFTIVYAYYLIQAIVLSLWLGIGPILPPMFDAGETQKPEQPVPS